MRSIGMIHGLAVAACMIGAPALGQGDGLVPTPDGRYRVGLSSNQVTLVDNVQFRTLIGNSTATFFTDNALQRIMRIEPRHCGADLIITLANTTGQPLPLGGFSIDGIRFPPTIKQWTFSQDTSSRNLSSYSWYNFWVYPADTYSPVQVIGDDRHTLGFSIHYPVLEYDHRTEIILQGEPTTTAWAGPPHWRVQFRMRGNLPPGETRTYTIAIRATTANRNFLYTLTPYRDYFRAQFGPVHYTRDPRPISGSSAAIIPAVNSSNPQGWFPSTMRPDVHGWSVWVNHLLQRRTMGFKRVMLWTPSGVFGEGSSLNFPYRFMTPINQYPLALSTLSEFHRIRGANMELGFWWGNNSTLMRGWANPEAEAFDPFNPEHVQLGFAELDLAVAAGVSMIGLDAFKQASPRGMHTWLSMMRARAPNVKFVTENAASDLVHNLSPTFHEGEHVRTPHLMADFLNPGHETWAAIQSTPESRAANRAPTNAEVAREMRRLASLGFVPLAYGVYQVPTITASESWKRTIPRDLQQPAGNNLLRNQPGLRR